MKQKFSNLNRRDLLETLEHESFDLIVIGGGITGAGILLDAASRGLKTLLVEKGDFASGTSSKSTKLIHGGLRYLKQLDFSLVREVGSERAIVHRIAPHLVIPEKMLLPLIENGSYNKWLTSVGLRVYDILANVDEDDQRRMLDKQEALKREPLLPENRIKGAGYYAEYRTDDARLTLENIKTALDYGATAINYLRVRDFIYSGHTLCGIKVRDAETAKEFTVRGSCVINATGPWVDELRSLNHSRNEKQLHLTKGVHLVFPHDKFPVKQSVYFDAPDGRMIFAIPRDRITYVGTTDTTYENNKDRITITQEDTTYILQAANHMFPNINLEATDILSSWAGLRPLIHKKGKKTSELSRKDEIFISDTGLISIAGGKLTGYRKMAERAVNKVVKKIRKDQDRTIQPCSTQNISLCGGPWTGGYREVLSYARNLKEEVQSEGLDGTDALYLVHNYGRQSERILKGFREIKEGEPGERLIRAEFRFCAEQEMILDPLDFFIRRTGRMFFRMASVQKYSQVILDDFAVILHPDAKQMATVSRNLEQAIRLHTLA